MSRTCFPDGSHPASKLKESQKEGEYKREVAE